MSNDKNNKQTESDWELRKKMGALYGAAPAPPDVKPANVFNAAGIPRHLGASPIDSLDSSLTRSVYGPVNLAGPFTNTASAGEMTGAIPASPSPTPAWENFNATGMSPNSNPYNPVP